ncbi:MAG: putative lipid II flippase FtsW [Firmicutes bacterium]|nr:putative lipid II flippase FtsW [Bacillota bacterium]
MSRETDRMPDLILFAAALLLVSLGLVMVFSSSSVLAMAETGDAFFYLKRQLIGVAVGMIAMLVIMQIDYHIYQRFAILAVVVAYILLIAVLVIGTDISGSRRWINLRVINLQPSELAKLALVNFVAAYAASRPHEMKNFWKGVATPLLVAAVFFGLIILEPDFGTAISMAGTAVIMLFACGARLGHLVLVGIMSLPLFGAMIWLEPYRMERILSFLDPWADPMNTGWNIIQSLLAIGSGGLFGLGLGSSRQKFFYLPEQHTDFIFAILGEELGFLGSIVTLVLFFVLAWRGFRIALRSPDLFGCFLAVGITSMIILQAILNIGVVSGILPVTGVTLPLISFGSSSMVVTLAGVGILLNISKQTR